MALANISHIVYDAYAVAYVSNPIYGSMAK